MKTRNGFVSNSSSSSFTIFGKWLNEEPNDVTEYELKGLRYYTEEESGPCIGVDFDIKDDETWGQYKTRVAKIMTEAGVPSEAKDMDLISGRYYC